MSFLILAAAMTLQVQVYTAQPERPRPRAPATNVAPSSAAPGAGENSPATGPDPEQVVCHMEPVTGSRFPRRVCRTERQMEADRNESQDMLRKMQKLPDIPA